jgi:hypothetical protein
MDINLPVPPEAAELTVDGHNGTARVEGYEWPAVRMIAAAELRRVAEAVEATVDDGPRIPRPDGYAQGLGDCKAALLDLLRSRAVVLGAVADPTHPERR